MATLEQLQVAYQMSSWVSNTGWNNITPDSVVDKAQELGVNDKTIEAMARRMDASLMVFNGETAVAAMAGVMVIVYPDGLSIEDE